MSDNQLRQLQETVWTYYAAHGRHDLPWRRPGANGRFDPYAIAVSEIMLQQTQVPRVVPKFETFVRQFPTARALAAAPLGAVLRAWSGLGYNRRAKYLWQMAQHMQAWEAGAWPRTAPAWTALPGVGPNTAAAIITYAFDEPAPFLETNIRTVFIHHLFPGQAVVPDKALLPLVTAAWPAYAADAGRGPRHWGWALMDYGTYLKQSAGNASRRSTDYTRQTRFEGSRRQVRGQVLRLLGEQPHTAAGLAKVLPDKRLGEVVAALENEGLIRRRGGKLML